MYASRAQHHRAATTARCTRCDGSLPLPLHLAIKRNEFQMMFPPTATWTRAVGLRGLVKLLKLKDPITGQKHNIIFIIINKFPKWGYFIIYTEEILVENIV